LAGHKLVDASGFDDIRRDARLVFSLLREVDQSVDRPKRIEPALQKHRTVAAVIGAAYRGAINPNTLNEQQWTDIVEFIRKPTEIAKILGEEWPASKGRWDGPKGYRAQMEAAYTIVTKIGQ
jgi:hypothetical protein